MTNFKNKFRNSIRHLAKIDKPDYTTSNTNNYADFIELLALLSGTDGISYGDIQDRFYGEIDENATSETNDKNESFIDTIFLLIEERITLYDKIYPFKKENDVIALKEDLLKEHKIYIFLLLSSSLNVFNSFMPELTTDFEAICYETMKLYLPNAIVKAFGKKSEYTGTAKEKIRKLADDIGLSINDYDFNQIDERNVQERGLDIVCWLPFNDNCSNLLVFLGQCACGKEYEYKQHDTQRFENYYQFYKIKPQHTLFIPYSLINPQKGKFYHSDYFEDNFLIFERLRLVNLLCNNTTVFDELQTKKLIEECIKYSRSI